MAAELGAARTLARVSASRLNALIVCATLTAIATPLRAADRDWNTGSGNWSVGTNWTPTTAPTSATTALIGFANGGTPYTVTVNSAGQAGSGLAVSSSAATLAITSGDLTIGAGGMSLTAGAVGVSGGTLTLNGASSSSAGTSLSLTGGRLNANAAVTVGGSFSFTNATLGGTGTVTGAGATVGGFVRVQDTATLVLNGATSLAGAGDLTVTPGATVRVGAGGTLTADVVSGTRRVFDGFEGTGGAFDVQGSLVKTGAGALEISGLAMNAAGPISANGGTLTIDNSTTLTQFNAGTNTLTGGTYNVNGATLNFGSRTISTVGSGATVSLNGAAATFTALNSLTANNGTLTVTGGQTFTPTAASVTNSGTFTVNSGSTFGKGVVGQSGGTLTGAGTVSGAVTAQTGTTIRPGDGTTIGTLTAGSLTFQDAAVLSLRGGASSNSKLSLTGGTPLTASGGDLTLSLNNDGTLVNGTTYTWTVISSTSSITGITPSDFAVTSDFALGGLPTVFLDANNVYVQFTPVPEPASVLGVAAAGLGLAGWVRRRRRAAAAA